MDVDEAAIVQGERSAEVEPELFSAEWWQGRSTTELRDIIKRGFSLGVAYDGAVAETERRAREALRRIRDQKDSSARWNAKLRLIVLGAVLAILLVFGLVQWLTGKGPSAASYQSNSSEKSPMRSSGSSRPTCNRTRLAAGGSDTVRIGSTGSARLS
jgi:hypothetical protein